MTATIEDNDNHDVFRDCVFAAVTNKLAPAKAKPTKRRKSIKVGHPDSNPTPSPVPEDPSELAEFSDYLATDIFTSLPSDLQTLSLKTLKSSPSLSDTYSLPLTLTTLESLLTHIPPSTTDSLTTYNLINPPITDTLTFISPILTSYITTLLTPQPPPIATKSTTKACELCLRDWIPLTYHHLIPRSTHGRVLKRGWHDESQLQNVAWLCRACHSFVHGMAGNEELAKEWFTVERIGGREDVRRWVGWVGKVRWKNR